MWVLYNCIKCVILFNLSALYIISPVNKNNNKTKPMTTSCRVLAIVQKTHALHIYRRFYNIKKRLSSYRKTRLWHMDIPRTCTAEAPCKIYTYIYTNPCSLHCFPRESSGGFSSIYNLSGPEKLRFYDTHKSLRQRQRPHGGIYTTACSNLYTIILLLL